MLVIGSTALRLAGIPWRQPKDFDYIATPQELEWFKESHKDKIVHSQKKRWGETLFVSGSDPIEFEVAYPGSNTEELLEIIRNSPKEYYKANFDGVTWVYPEIVYWMKMSHRFLKNSPHFKKSMDDIIELRKQVIGLRVSNFGPFEPDARYQPKLAAWYKRRVKETYDYKHPVLDKKKNEFFANDGINYIYDHDSLHESVKHLTLPAFNYIKKDAADILCSKDKFFQIPEYNRLLCVLEETYVLALERSLIPNNFKINPMVSFKIALEKVCTSITSGWFRAYAWEHYYQVLELYDPNILSESRFIQALATGIIKPYVK